MQLQGQTIQCSTTQHNTTQVQHAGCLDTIHTTKIAEQLNQGKTMPCVISEDIYGHVLPYATLCANLTFDMHVFSCIVPYVCHIFMYVLRTCAVCVAKISSWQGLPETIQHKCNMQDNSIRHNSMQYTTLRHTVALYTTIQHST